ncbi:hypothetical protein [Capillimicrobium parvum]|uniref:hypothetical protein n=1 Tax=Capillimicrobium parvum TaxID=2884022 RepID=UPI00216B132E|nr:hypothetical protein [Capillimicrobium parvum]
MTYDLRGCDETSADYADLITEIGAYANCRRIMLSTWLIVSEWTAKEILDDLARHIDRNDRCSYAPSASLPRGAT